MADGTNTTTETEATGESTEATEETQGTETEADGPISAEEAARIRAALAKANKQSEHWRLKAKEADDAQLSEVEKAKRDAAEATQKLAQIERDNLLKTVALAEGVPAKWVNRLVGDTEEELVADARAILADLAKQPKKPEPDASQGARQTAKVSGWDTGKAEAQKRFGK
ncbi:scaffolding protein [Arthrobacter phage Auxilium]|uniref:Scaffolding protein n=2 Tax=Richievirus TaxID=3044803 RepID=A0A3G2KIN0_9CAUD|nr:scaffolding protein [Arthrobacter phage Richie]YP_010655825.1 scaffolding protein [Arthrobacter phage Auxilium]AYN55786.1 scaffolding protein [Arthrobacter phage Auxilium]AYN58834.1 scaffolding protein [Arthrobacter phage Richie]